MPNPRFTQTYEEYAADPAPLKLARELAEMRCLIAETRDAIDQSRSDSALSFIQGQAISVRSHLEFFFKQHLTSVVTRDLIEGGYDQDEIDSWSKFVEDALQETISNTDHNLVATIKDHYRLHNGSLSRNIRIDEASALAKMYEGVGRVAEKMKKLEDGLVLKVDYGAELLEILSILVVKIVLPYVPVDLRLQCAKEADEVLPMLVHRLKLEAIDGKVN